MINNQAKLHLSAIHRAFIRAHLARDDSIFSQCIQELVARRAICAYRGSLSRATLLFTMITIFFEDVGAPDLCADTWARFSACVTGPVAAAIAAVIECARAAIHTRNWYPIYGARLEWCDNALLAQLSIEQIDFDASECTNNDCRSRIAEIVQIQRDMTTVNYYSFYVAHAPLIWHARSSATDDHCAQLINYTSTDASIAELRACLVQYHMRAITSICAPHIAIALDDISRRILGLPTRDENNAIIEHTLLQTWDQIATNIVIGNELIILQVINRSNELIIAHDSRDPHIAFFLGPLTVAQCVYAYNFAMLRCAILQKPNITHIYRSCNGNLYATTEIVGQRAPFVMRSVQHVMVTRRLRALLSHQIACECILRYIMNLPGRGYVAGIYTLVDANGDARVYHVGDIYQTTNGLDRSMHSEIASYIAQNNDRVISFVARCIEVFTELSRIESIAQAHYPLRAHNCGEYTPAFFETCISRAQSLSELYDL